MTELIDKLEKDHSEALTVKSNQLVSERAEFEKQIHSQKRATKLMICLQNFVRDMLKEKLENREQELQLQIIQVRESADNYCAELEKNREDFENYKLEKSREVDEFKSYKDDSAKKSGQIDAFDAQI